jgi:hypothetical protein
MGTTMTEIVIDGEMRKFGGEVASRPTVEVMDELDAAEEAARAAARYARRTTHEERKSELTPVEERVGKLHKKLHTA